MKDLNKELIEACREGNIEEVKLLIEAGADVNAVDDFRFSPSLMWASYYGHTGIAKLLIDAGADINAVNKDCHTALTWAVRDKDIEMIKLLIDAGAK